MYLAWREEIQPARGSLWLLIPILVFACGTFIRREPFTTFTNILLILVSMGVYAHTYVGGRWLKYSLSDYLAAFFYLSLSSLTKPIEMLIRAKSSVDNEGSFDDEDQSTWRRSLPYLRGLLIAIPVILIFSSLFAAADPIFENYWDNFVELFRLEKLPEYFFRGFYILLIGYLLTGIYLHAFTNKKDESLISEKKPWLPSFLGFPEAAIVLGSVDVLFSLFVGIQFRYFFGGQSNIRIDGFTYATYARRGFSELVLVSVFALLLFLSLSAVSRRDNKSQRRVFSGMGIALVLLVVVILVSAFQRLWLYEQAYGFTRLRTYSHVFMVWLGILLTGVVILELFRRQRAFALATYLVAIGFVISLNLINVDGWIVDQNVRHALLVNFHEEEDNKERNLDASYLYSLSSDATPAMVLAQQNQALPEVARNELAAVLACQSVSLAEIREDKGWQSYHFADERAWRFLSEHRDDFRSARVYNQDGSWWVEVNNEHRPCYNDTFGYD